MVNSSKLLVALFLKLSFLLSGGILVLLVLGHQVIHVALSLGELHLVHALSCVPMQESFTPEHGRELLGDSLEQLLDGSAVANEGGGHFEPTRWNVADGGLDIVGDPFDKVAAVLVLNIEHLLIHLLHGHASTEDSGDSQVAAVTGVAGGHHVLGVEHLLGEFRNGQRAVLLAAPAGQRSEAGHEEVQTREGHHVHRQFTEICVQLAGEPQAGGDAAHGGGDKVVEVTVCGCCEFESAEADVIKRFIVNAVGFICVFHQLMDRQRGIVGLDHCV